MNASISSPHQGRSISLATLAWLAAFLSPTALFLLMAFASRLRIQVAPSVVVGLFCLTPLVALWICGSVVWSHSTTTGRKIGWMLFTLLAMVLQVGILLVILRAILVTVIALFVATRGG